MIRKFKDIIMSNIAPTNKETIWLKNDTFYYYDGQWKPINGVGVSIDSFVNPSTDDKVSDLDNKLTLFINDNKLTFNNVSKALSKNGYTVSSNEFTLPQQTDITARDSFINLVNRNGGIRIGVIDGIPTLTELIRNEETGTYETVTDRANQLYLGNPDDFSARVLTTYDTEIEILDQRLISEYSEFTIDGDDDYNFEKFYSNILSESDCEKVIEGHARFVKIGNTIYPISSLSTDGNKAVLTFNNVNIYTFNDDYSNMNVVITIEPNSRIVVEAREIDSI